MRFWEPNDGGGGVEDQIMVIWHSILTNIWKKNGILFQLFVPNYLYVKDNRTVNVFLGHICV